MNVLLIEDNEDDAELIREALVEQLGHPFALKWAAHLKAGLDMLTHEPVDAILVDLSLPDSQGLETIDKLRARFRDAPVIVLTGLDDEGVAEEALPRGSGLSGQRAVERGYLETRYPLRRRQKPRGASPA